MIRRDVPCALVEVVEQPLVQASPKGALQRFALFDEPRCKPVPRLVFQSIASCWHRSGFLGPYREVGGAYAAASK